MRDKIRNKLTFSEQRMFFLERMNDNDYINIIPLSMKLFGTISVERLKKSLNQILRKHEVLRSNYDVRGKEIFRIIRDNVDVELMLFNTDNDGSVDDILSNHMIKPFDLTNELLSRFCLIKIDDNEYIFVAVFHHIVFDGFSASIFKKDLLWSYDESNIVESPSLPIIRNSYFDYVKRQHEYIGSDMYYQDLSYWRKRLSDFEDKIPMFADHTKKTNDNGASTFFSQNLTLEISNKIREKCKYHRVTSFVYMFSIFSIFLYAYTRERTYVIGIPITNRTTLKDDDVIGLYVNTVLICGMVDSQLLFSQYLKYVRRNVSDAFLHSKMPFERLVDEINPERQYDMIPFHKIMFSMNKADDIQHTLQDLSLTPFEIDVGYNQYDLSLTITEYEDVYSVSIEYNKSMFEETTIHRIYAYLVRLFYQSVQESDIQICEYTVLDDIDRRVLLSQYTPSVKDWYTDSTLFEMFASVAAENSEKIAIISEKKTISYKSLLGSVNSLSYQLREKELSVNDIVAIITQEKSDVIVAILSAMQIGAIFLVIDAAQPLDRINYIIKDSNPTMILCSRDNAIFFPHYLTMIIEYDTNVLKLYNEYKPFNNEEQPSCVIYTSGSTGHPKGVLLSMKGLKNTIASFIYSYKADKNDRILPLTSPASASFIGEILPMLCVGGSIMLSEDEEYLYADNMSQIIKDMRITIISTVPSLIEHLSLDNDNQLRLILSGGESLTSSQISGISNISIVNGYGLTEGSICSSFFVINRGCSGFDSYPAGRPIMNTGIYILDEQNNPVPIGCAGEVYIYGKGLAIGYLNEPEATINAFLPDPYRIGERMFKTGDYGMWSQDLMFKYLDRKDNQVQIRGYRVELEEIKNMILLHPIVKECAVIAQKNEKIRIIAYVVPIDDVASHNMDVRMWLHNKLPSYMMPHSIILVKTIPHNINGKTDIELLKVANNRNGIRHSNNSFEDIVIGIWKDLLGTDELDIDINIFDVGAHSLMLIQACQLINDRCNIDLKIVDMFKYPTIRSLCDYIVQCYNIYS